MTEHDDNTPPDTPSHGSWAAARPRVKKSVKAHFDEYGSRKCRALLREDPELSPWIGKAVGNNGETGKKRLERLFREVEAEAARAKKHSLRASMAPPRQDIEDPSDPLRQFLAGGSAVVGYAELQAHLRDQRDLMYRAMVACLDEGGLKTFGLLIRLGQECRAIDRESASLTKSYHADMSSAELQQRLIRAAFESHAGDPEKQRALIDAFDEIFSECSGLSARGGGK
jgi:hypothetical protein